MCSGEMGSLEVKNIKMFFRYLKDYCMEERIKSIFFSAPGNKN
jgi:hypothetical protein